MKFERLLQKLCTFSNHHQHRVSCIIANKNQIVSMGYNKIKTSPRALNPYNMLHAEISALLGLSYEDTRKCTAYVYRERRDGTLGIAKPCESCEKALRSAGISKVVYTDDNCWKEERI